MNTLQRHVSLKQFNTFGIDAQANYFFAVQSIPDFELLFAHEDFKTEPKFILGEGSNILLTGDYPGFVIKNAIKGIQVVSEDDEHIWLKVGGGENWHDFVMYCVQQGYGGIENLSLIPGTVGAAPIQNIGAYGVELRQHFFQLEALHLQDGTLRTFTHDECQFGYRDSVFKNTYKDQYAILSVTLCLDKKPQFQLDYGNIKETLQQMDVNDINLKTISDAIIHIRRSKLPDPKQLGNAGSFFKNPMIPAADLVKLQKKFPQIPHFSTEHPELKKVSAAWLIEQCGWKGKRFGDVGIYEKQALILVNYGVGRGVDIKKLALEIQSSVLDEFGIMLMPEVNFI